MTEPVQTNPVTIVKLMVPGSQGPPGDQGVQGPANILGIGTVAASAPGSAAQASITGTYPNQVLNLTLPRGDIGPANTLVIGTVTSGAAGSSAVATITGTAPNQTLNLTIPRGDTGATAVDATTTSKGSIQLAGDLGGTAAAPTVISGANHTHADLTSATTNSTPSTLVKRDASGNISVGLVTGSTAPSNVDHLTRKDYVDSVVTRAIRVAGVSNTGAADNNKWTKVGTATISSQYADVTMDLAFVGNGSGSSPATYADAYFRVKQQAAMGSNPSLSLQVSDVSLISPTDFYAQTETMSASQTVVSLYVRIPSTYEGLSVFENSMVLGSGSWTYFTNQAFLTTLPTAVGATISGSYKVIDGLVIGAGDAAAGRSNLVRRDANGVVNFEVVGISQQPSTIASATRKDYVDNQDLAFRRRPNRAVGGATYTIVAADEGALIYSNAGAANTFTIPSNANAALPVGFWVDILRADNNATTIAPDSGVTLIGDDGVNASHTIRYPYAQVRVTKYATNSWNVAGAVTDSTYTAVAGATSAIAGSNLVRRDASGQSEFNQVFLGQTGTAINTATRKDYVDGAVSTHNSATVAHGATGAVVGTTNTQTLSGKTISGLIVPDFEDILEVAAPAVPAANYQRIYIDSTSKSLTLKSNGGAVRRSTYDWGSGATLPASGMNNGDVFYHTGWGCSFQYNGAGWRQSTIPTFNTNAARNAAPTNALHAGFKIWHSGLLCEQTYDAANTTWRFQLCGQGQYGTDANGLIAIAHGAGQAPRTYPVAGLMFSQTEAQNQVTKVMAWSGNDASNLYFRFYRTDTSAAFNNPSLGIAWVCDF